jgi:hypothetical protein
MRARMGISFHTLRHWKGTMRYHKTRDLLHIQDTLGYRDVQSSQVHIQLNHALFSTESDEFHVKTAETIPETRKLEAGFEYVTTIDEVQVFRTRK